MRLSGLKTEWYENLEPHEKDRVVAVMLLIPLFIAVVCNILVILAEHRCI